MAKTLEQTGETNGDQAHDAAHEQLSYKPLGKNPLSDRQNNTDLSFTYILCGLFITFCIGITIDNSAVETYTEENVNYRSFHSTYEQRSSYYKKKYTIDVLSDFIDERDVKKTAIICTVTTLMIVLGFLRLLKSDEKKGFIIHIAKIVMIFVFFCSFLGCLIFIASPFFYLLICFSLIIIYAVSIVGSINTAGVTTIARFMTKSCQAILFFRILIIFAICIMILITFVLMVTITAYERNRSDFLHFMTTIGGIYICLFIMYFGKMTVAQTIATWHWAQDKEAISSTTILKCVGIICRFHLGSIALGATVVWPLYFALRIVFKSQSDTSKQSRPNRFFSMVCKIYMILFLSGYALIITSIHGQSFFKAAKKAFSIMAKNYSLWLGVTNVITVITLIATLVIIPLSMLATSFISYVFSEIHVDSSNFMKTMLLSSLYLLIPIWMMVQTAVDTTLVCSFDDSEENDKNEFQSCTNQSCSRPTAPPLEV